mgnify:CR=1 FL=1|jgi:hypothetical protein
MLVEILKLLTPKPPRLKHKNTVFILVLVKIFDTIYKNIDSIYGII